VIKLRGQQAETTLKYEKNTRKLMHKILMKAGHTSQCKITLRTANCCVKHRLQQAVLAVIDAGEQGLNAVFVFYIFYFTCKLAS
jgi:hypothetical protein